jgi:hypothetical protein
MAIARNIKSCDPHHYPDHADSGRGFLFPCRHIRLPFHDLPPDRYQCQDAERSVLTALQRRYMIIKEEQNA